MLIWGLQHRSRSRSRWSRYILPGAGAGAVETFYSEPEPEFIYLFIYLLRIFVGSKQLSGSYHHSVIIHTNMFPISRYA